MSRIMPGRYRGGLGASTPVLEKSMSRATVRVQMVLERLSSLAFDQNFAARFAEDLDISGLIT